MCDIITCFNCEVVDFLRTCWTKGNHEPGLQNFAIDFENFGKIILAVSYTFGFFTKFLLNTALLILMIRALQL